MFYFQTKILMDKDTASYFAKYYTLYASYIAKINLMEMWYYNFDDWIKEMQLIGNDIMNEMQKDFWIQHREKSLVDNQDANV